MKALLIFIAFAFSFFSSAQTLEGGNKNFGELTSGNSRWFFTQTISKKELNRNKYNNRVFNIKPNKIDKDINKDGTPDYLSFLRLNNSFKYNDTDLILITPFMDKWKGTEIEIYTDCWDCIKVYKDGVIKNLEDVNVFYRYSKVAPTNDKEVRTIESLPMLIQIPKNSNRKSVTLELGYIVRASKKESCSKNEESDYPFSYTNPSQPHIGLKDEESLHYLKLDENCRASQIKSSTKISTRKIEWGKEIVFDKFIAIYKYEL